MESFNLPTEMISQHLLKTSRNFKQNLRDSELLFFIFVLTTKTRTLTPLTQNLHISPAGVGVGRGWGEA